MLLIVAMVLGLAEAGRRGVTKLAERSPLRKLGFTSVPSSGNCTWRTFTQPLDHFGPSPVNFSERVCIYDGFLNGPTPFVLFYTGNESPVEEYVNNTGLMWELGAEMNALLVFAEHRYEGESVPDMHGIPNCLSYCTVEQALADYAELINSLQSELGEVPFVAVGGSYGGMLSSWFRMTYPLSVVGAIAGSAPIWGFPTIDPILDGSSVAIGRSFSKAGGLPTDHCRNNLLGAWPLITAIGRTRRGREYLAEKMGLCDSLASGDKIARAVQNVFFDLAEANYPFPSTYITSAVGPGYFPLPAWPIGVACDGLQDEAFVVIDGNISEVNFEVSVVDGLANVFVDWDDVTAPTPFNGYEESLKLASLLKGVARVWSTWCNVTGALQCLSASAGAACVTGGAPPALSTRSKHVERTLLREEEEETAEGVCTAATYSGGSWVPVCCNDDLNLVNTIVQGVGRDGLFWPPNVPRDWTVASVLGVPEGGTTRGCLSSPGLTGYPPTSDPWATHMIDIYGDQSGARTATNIVFSNGLLDPWSAAGVFNDLGPTTSIGPYTGPAIQNLSDSVFALILDLGAHHLDLFFMDDNDPPCATAARDFETNQILSWLP